MGWKMKMLATVLLVIVVVTTLLASTAFAKGPVQNSYGEPGDCTGIGSGGELQHDQHQYGR